MRTITTMSPKFPHSSAATPGMFDRLVFGGLKPSAMLNANNYQDQWLIA